MCSHRIGHFAGWQKLLRCNDRRHSKDRNCEIRDEALEGARCPQHRHDQFTVRFFDCERRGMNSQRKQPRSPRRRSPTFEFASKQSFPASYSPDWRTNRCGITKMTEVWIHLPPICPSGAQWHPRSMRCGSVQRLESRLPAKTKQLIAVTVAGVHTVPLLHQWVASHCATAPCATTSWAIRVAAELRAGGVSAHSASAHSTVMLAEIQEARPRGRPQVGANRREKKAKELKEPRLLSDLMHWL